MTYIANPKHYSRQDFAALVDGFTWSKGWRPKFPTLHNTGVPSLKQWQAYGATTQERWGASLNRYYQGLGWHAGPHLVCCPDYIWVLCDPEANGVSVSCWNSVTFGIEMVGDYRAGGDDPTSGDGLKVVDNAVFAIATLAKKLGILAVPYASAADVVGRYGDALSGKVVIDITNPVAPDVTGLVTPEGSSGAQEIAKAATAGAHVVKAFNTVFGNVLTADAAKGRSLDVFIAGDDARAKADVSAFVESLGLRPLDAGPLPIARALENAGLLEISLMNHALKNTSFALGVTVLS